MIRFFTPDNKPAAILKKERPWVRLIVDHNLVTNLAATLHQERGISADDLIARARTWQRHRDWSIFFAAFEWLSSCGDDVIVKRGGVPPSSLLFFFHDPMIAAKFRLKFESEFLVDGIGVKGTGNLRIRDTSELSWEQTQQFYERFAKLFPVMLDKCIQEAMDATPNHTGMDPFEAIHAVVGAR
jgi:hypothetical protein